MRKIITLLAYLLMVSGNLLAQYSTDWIRPADNYLKTGTMIARDSLDNLFVTGYIQSQNIYTRKYNKFGALQWEKISTSGIASNYEKPVWISTDKNNNALVVGYRYATSSGRDYPGAIVVLKYNPSGALLWKKNISVSVLVNRSLGFNLRCEVDNNGNLYIGTVTANPSGFNLYKLNSSGITVFIKSSSANAPNGFNSMRLKGNKIVMTGSSGNRSVAPVIAWDTTGALLWTASLLGQGGKDVEVDDAGNTYLLTSYANQVSETSGQDILLYKFNSSGGQVWKKNYDFGGYDYPTRFTLVADKLSVIGYGSINASYFDWITFQVNADGVMLWNARYNGTPGNDELPGFIAAKSNGEVFVTGKGGPTPVATNLSGLRMITLKYSNTGVVKWVDSVNIYSGWGLACTLAKDSSLFVLSTTNMTAFHFLDQTATGTCGIPTGIFASNITTTSAPITWSPVTGANLYHLRYKTVTATTWTVVSTNLTTYLLSGLSGGTSYNYEVEAVCNSGPSGYSATQTFTTFGTGYCTTGGLSTTLEYLNLVWIGGIINQTQSNNGYADFTNLSTPLNQGQTVYGYLSGKVPYPEYENYSIWIDYNHNNSFSDPGEQVVNISSDFTGYIAINFTVPTGIPGGPTRMRVTMCYGVAPTPCGTYARGETEDYTVDIAPVFVAQGKQQPGVGKVIPGENNTIGFYPNPVADILYVKGLSSNITGLTIEVYDITGRKLLVSSNSENSVNVSSLKKGIYTIRVIQNRSYIFSGRFVKK